MGESEGSGNRKGARKRGNKGQSKRGGREVGTKEGWDGKRKAGLNDPGKKEKQNVSVPR